MLFISSVHDLWYDFKHIMRACAHPRLLVPEGGHIWPQHCNAMFNYQSRQFLALYVRSHYTTSLRGVIIEADNP